MIKLLLLALASVLPDTAMYYRPVHMMQSDVRSCGATKRFMKERLKIDTAPRVVEVNNMEWDFQGPSCEIEGYWIADYHTEGLVSLQVRFSVDDAYYTLSGVDEKRRPCQDTVYLKRVR